RIRSRLPRRWRRGPSVERQRTNEDRILRFPRPRADLPRHGPHLGVCRRFHGPISSARPYRDAATRIGKALSSWLRQPVDNRSRNSPCGLAGRASRASDDQAIDTIIPAEFFAQLVNLPPIQALSRPPVQVKSIERYRISFPNYRRDNLHGNVVHANNRIDGVVFVDQDLNEHDASTAWSRDSLFKSRNLRIASISHECRDIPAGTRSPSAADARPNLPTSEFAAAPDDR